MAVIVFVAPHQDDETLSMGPSIRRHLDAGHEVHTLLLTNGVNSAVRGQTGLTRPAFSAARDDEYRRACAALGVPAEQVHITRHSTPDGALTQQAADDAMSAFLEEYPGTWVKAYSQQQVEGRHADHVNCGAAAVAMARRGSITNLRLYAEPWLASKFTGLASERSTNDGAVLAACDHYTVVDRAAGRYGIGGLSVPDAFAQVRRDRTSYYHFPPA